MQVEKRANHITLKEASEISGYTPDYLGQLIRSGKLEGEQVYMNTAWMTTEDAVKKYIQKVKGNSAQAQDETAKERVYAYALKHWQQWYKTTLYVVIGVNILFLLILTHLMSFSIEKHFEARDLEYQWQSYQG